MSDSGGQGTGGGASKPQPRDASEVAAIAASSSSEKRPNDARTAYEHAAAECEAAYMSGDRERIKATTAALHEAGQRMARAAAPSFESLLRDPTVQVRGDEVGPSMVRLYENAQLATVCACNGSLHKGCGSRG